MARRSCTSRQRGSVYTPDQSGPRCRCRDERESARGRKGVRSAPGVRSNRPRMEHMGQVLEGKSRAIKKQQNKKNPPVVGGGRRLGPQGDVGIIAIEVIGAVAAHDPTIAKIPTS